MAATTIAEFIDYLKTLPPDTELQVVRGYACGYDYCTEAAPLEIDENTGFCDLTGSPHVKEDNPLYNKKILFLGET